ncbi:MAG: DNA/RNA helicase domain-containing protein [Chitinophagaceae bacterium]
MNSNFDLSIEVSEQYDFTKESLKLIENNPWVKNQWPLVYFIQNESKKIAYVGESTYGASRLSNHLQNPERRKLNKVSIIGSDKFNKSATLDIESNLIQYITGEGVYELQNGNYGQINHRYYQQDLYKNLFKEIWKKLTEKKIVTKSLSEIENSELFKYSPYKSLNEDQYSSVLDILHSLTTKNTSRIFVSGSAGTGKTILATYLIKLLNSDTDEARFEDFNDDELREINYIKAFKSKYPNAKIGLVIAMTSLRGTLKTVFRKIPGLTPSMVINPSETFKSRDKYDLLIVDEAHRLRQFRNIGWMGVFRENNKKLGLDDSGTELDWIIANSKNQIFFYDSAQSVKPSDVDSERFKKLLHDKKTIRLSLKSQMRVKGGNNYIQFVDDIMNSKRLELVKYEEEKYDLLIFDSFVDLYSKLTENEKKYGLCRLVAGYAWPWLSDPKLKPKPDTAITDIKLDELNFKWNSTDKDWVNSPNAFKEIGCIHTTQGYDLNYCGVIFGNEIIYNKKTSKIEIDPSHYFDKYGKQGISDPEELRLFIINIYKTLLYRGIRGTYVYACNKDMRDYLKKHIKEFKKKPAFRVLKFNDVKPYVNSIPLLDITAAAGNFSGSQKHPELIWVEPPFNISARKGYFICKVVGESMNKKIPSDSYCLFKEDEGGSRNGEIVLVQSSNIQDSDFGSGFTVKEYHSEKVVTSEGWNHVSIKLKPLSNKGDYSDIILVNDELTDFKVVGIFERVLF